MGEEVELYLTNNNCLEVIHCTNFVHNRRTSAKEFKSKNTQKKKPIESPKVNADDEKKKKKQEKTKPKSKNKMN